MRALLCCVMLATGCVSVPVPDLKPAPEAPEADRPKLPLGASAVPPAVDVEKFLPPAPEPVPCEESMTDFVAAPTPLVGDFTIRYRDQDEKPQSWILHQGVLISECEAVKVVNIRTKTKRLQLELGAYKTLRFKERDLWGLAEYEYQIRILGLEKELKDAQEESFWDEWKFEIGIGVGIGISAALVVGAVEIVQAVGK